MLVELRDALDGAGDQPGDIAHVPGPALAAALDELTGVSPSERVDPGAEHARRDDLARDVARLWREQRHEGGHMPSEEVCDALDRLSAAYGEQP